MSLMTGSNFFPSLFSLSISLQRYIRHPRDRGFDPVRLIVSYGPLVRTSFSVALKALAHDLRSPFGQFHAYEVNQRCTTKVCLGKQAGPFSIPCQGTLLSQALTTTPCHSSPLQAGQHRSHVQPRAVRH
jgi:hypothetical protein